MTGTIDRFDEAQPQRTWLSGRAEIPAAVQRLIGLGQRQLRGADRDLEAFGLSSSAAVAAMERFLLDHRSARVRLLVDEAVWLDARAPRLRALQRRFPHALELRIASSDDAVGEDSFLIADDRHLLMLKRTPQGIGDLWVNNEPHAQPWASGFDRRWEAAAHNLPVAPLGL